MQFIMSQKPTIFYLVRHGETQQNKNNIIQGHLDTDLNETGISQAQKLAEIFESIWLDNVYASDLKRAQQTAVHIVSKKNLPIESHYNLREIKLGDYEGKSIEKFHEELGELLAFRDALPKDERFSHKVKDNIESDEELVIRFNSFFEETKLETEGKTNLVVTHGAAIRIFLIYLGWATYSELPHGNVKNTAYVKLEKTEDGFRVVETLGVVKSTDNQASSNHIA
ncbi:MAG: histidine phosphatase family protein [Candidatus Pacebacteria bacterium CG10_big_fil_rev_8_21_14_0_10_36_11]|nr:MAG: histidine phosphatase family protein [Candidatus Pacebacteria bacterium CG10_big_fil_rev_8_21_14_0_10_36_11]PJC42647.1 MAG: histidine phosphatase family protein [Candidatus Pacebacteria bacterium CG_4_9_14_0_2_um_filter_36_8]